MQLKRAERGFRLTLHALANSANQKQIAVLRQNIGSRRFTLAKILSSAVD